MSGVDGILEQLLGVFPDADAEHVRQRITATSVVTPERNALFDQLVTEMLSTEYPKKIAEMDLTRQDPAQAAKELSDKTKCLAELRNLFSDVDVRWLENLYDQTFEKKKDSAITAEIVGNHLIENPSYPKRKRITAPVPAIARTASGTVLDLTDAPVVSRNASGLELGRAPAVDYDNTTIAVSSAYREMCSAQLQNEFPWLGVPAIKKIMVETNDHYTPARKKLRAMVGEIPDMWPEHARPPNPTVKVLSKKRNPVSMPAERDEGFIRELAWARREDELARADRDWAMQKELNDKATEEEQTIECSCCCCDYPFSDMVQCNDGHLFCSECLKRYVEQTVFGNGQTDVHCLDHSSGCKERFPISQLQRALPPKMYKKLIDRIADLEVRKAGIEGLHQCPFCDYMAEIANKDEKVFKCLNPECGKETCIQCKELSHIPLRCEEVEKKNESDFRKSVEEELSEALVRVCPKCKARFLKSDGCNKISCQCGTLLCYVCREVIPPKLGYGHFCSHNRNPMHMGACKECKKCYLFLKDTQAEDEKLVEEARRAAEERARQQNPDLAAKVKEIGGKDDKRPKKKPKKSEAPAYNPFGFGAAPAMVHQLVRAFQDDSMEDSDELDDSDNSDDMEVEMGYRPYIMPPVPPPVYRAPVAVPAPIQRAGVVRRAPPRKRKR